LIVRIIIKLPKNLGIFYFVWRWLILLIILNSLNFNFSIQIIFMKSIFLIFIIPQIALITFKDMLWRVLKSPRKCAHIIKIWMILLLISWLISDTMFKSKFLLLFELLHIALRGCCLWFVDFLVGIALSIACFCYLYWVIIFSNSHLSKFSIVFLSLFKSIIIILISHVGSWIVYCRARETAKPPSWLFLGSLLWM
jgi:hypothetical protein